MSIRTSAFATVTLLRSLTLSFPLCHHHFRCRNYVIRSLSIPTYSAKGRRQLTRIPAFASSSSVEALVHDRDSPAESEEPLCSPYSTGAEGFASADLKHLGAPALEVKELDELPEQWRRSKLAWLCKELPAHKPGTLIRLLNAQRKWMKQDDAAYVIVHCLRIRENETAFRVYKWMMQQHWYRFDYALATKLADYMGKERKFSKCREVFDDIINQGCVPSESTFHILIVAYLSAPIQGCIEEASAIYNRMIQLGGYEPRLSLHNSLFKALLSKPGDLSKHHLKQAEFIYHNLVTTGLELHKDIYAGLIWLHSYQDTVDKERIMSLRKEMQQAGIEEEREVLVSILRASSKLGDVMEAERSWLKLKSFDGSMPSQAFVYKMEVYAKVGNPMKAFEIFREMEQLNSVSAAAYQTIIGILCKVEEVTLAESVMEGFIKSNLKPLKPAYVDLMNMFFNLSLHDKLELTFSQCLEKCKPNRTIYSIYLNSLVKVGNLDRAEEIFSQMQTNGEIGVSARSCNIILSGYLLSGDYLKAEKIYDLMCQKKYDIDPPLMEKLDYVLSLSRKEIKKPVSLKLSKEQREILVGLLLGGLEIESDEGRKNHRIQFEFHEDRSTHSRLRRHIYEQYHEWLHPASKSSDSDTDIPYKFCTVSHSYFGFYADQFWPRGHPAIPNLIHRWLSPRVLAYWYMYGGCRISSGDFVLKLKGSREGVAKIVKSLGEKSMSCKVKRKGRVYWIGLLGSNATWFWKLIEPFILDDLKDRLQADSLNMEKAVNETYNINFDSQSDSDEEASS
ncbi:pentatricopeptide repeat-containing protein At2g15820, chloroplastic-like [Cucurbita pepo subsp. pepo]|uniref:pentatricopeptide repeat-containing protein At2g15820, chloroplastic-like n=1 Tax=Cucurbita pepo subsp. pepo TaxID=3664 RepID=UPI000C9D4D0B|nr:pentatricopeptide repeat-containing protein At2g15820, chloroplastic-like [Cucurbita pepo subsp. pepo]